MTRIKKLWLYDLFDSEYNQRHHHTEPGSDPYLDKKDQFRYCQNVNIIKGFIPDSFDVGVPDAVSFLHIDLNKVEGEIAALETMWDRLTVGCLCVLDDYGQHNYAPQKLAEDAFFARRGYHILELPTGQGIVLK